jgi:hypothetical protein
MVAAVVDVEPALEVPGSGTDAGYDYSRGRYARGKRPLVAKGVS